MFWEALHDEKLHVFAALYTLMAFVAAIMLFYTATYTLALTTFESQIWLKATFLGMVYRECHSGSPVHARVPHKELLFCAQMWRCWSLQSLSRRHCFTWS